MEWRDEGIVLAVQRHGETDAVLHALTFEHGRHAGLVKGGAGRTARPLLQPGNRLELVWRARLAEHLGHFRVEPVRLLAAALLDDPLRLAALASACGLLEQALPERDPHPRLYAAVLTWLERLAGGGGDAGWAADYVRLEFLLLAELGFALDFSACAVTGATTGLAYVSPRTGRAVSRDAAGELAPRLLPLPGFLVGGTQESAEDVAQGLRLAGHFLRRHIFEPADRPLPAARERLVALWREASESAA
jgi:DNA repair protein RecO (recombination protein O)